jgi:Uma2 family endonuclease
MTIQEKLFTIEEFETYTAAHPDQCFELIDGRIVEKVTSEEHGVIALKIGAKLLLWIESHDIKGHAGVEISHHRPRDKYNQRKPDISFRYASDAASRETALPQMPDFAVEIKSKHNSFEQLRDKAKFYIANGTRLVWLVYPTKQLVEVYDADGRSDIFKVGDILEGGAVLPAFQLDLATIFAAIAE